MKIVRLFEDWDTLNEIGDASVRPLRWKKTKEVDEGEIQGLDYTFTTSLGTDYIAFFTSEERKIYDFSFTVKGKELTTVSNKGEMFEVMATIVDIFKDALDTLNFYEVRFTGTKNFATDNRRSKLYRSYLEKHLPKKYRVSYIMGETVIKHRK